MRSYIVFLLTILFFIACKKKKNSNTAFTGVWVETFLRLDTFDFEFGNQFGSVGQYSTANFTSNRYIDTVLNRDFPVTHSSIYEYYFTSNRTIIGLKSSYSSSTSFGEYKFSLSGDKRKFTVDKFYNRRALPAVIEFERIK
jgi:hypothetical protein